MRTLLRLLIAAIVLFASIASSSAQQQRTPAEPKSTPRTALDHLRAARSSAGEIRTESLTADAAAKIKDIRQQLAALEQTYVSHGKKTTSKQETASGSTRVRIAHAGTWSSQVPEIDKLLGDLIDSKTVLTTRQDANDGVQRKLAAVRADLTAFAKAATGTSGPPR